MFRKFVSTKDSLWPYYSYNVVLLETLHFLINFLKAKQIMIYDYEIQYDTSDNITGYQYTVPTGDGTSLTRTIVADGITDDKISLQLVLNEIDNLGGGTIILPPNITIGINSIINLKDNITIKSSGNTIFKDLAEASTMFQCFGVKNVIVDGLVFEGIETTIINQEEEPEDVGTIAAIAIRENADGSIFSENITIQNCEFRDVTFKATIESSAAFITAKNTNEITVKNCKFSNGSLGISVSGSNKNMYLRDNVFNNTLDNNPIRISGSSANGERTENLWITGNQMEIGRAASEIENTVITRLEDGRAFFNGYDVNTKPIGNGAINITCKASETVKLHHENVVIENNIAEGPDYGFFDGGSGDLYSLKDVERLTCTGNRVRNSGDLGFAIERCHFAIISNNTADRNNSCGISIFDSTNVNVVGNVCRDNELTRDGLYATNPYGGIRVEGDSFNVLVEGNFFFTSSSVQRSLVNVNSLINENKPYNSPGVPTQQYGVVVQQSGESGSADNTSGIGGAYQKTPFNVKVGHNHTSTHFWGTVYNKMKATQIVDTYSSHTFPLKADYPLGARLRNNLTFASTSATKEWYVSHRIELFVKKDVNLINDPNNIIEVAVRTGIPGNQTSFLDENGQNSNFKYIINDDLTTIQQDDIIGVMLDDYSVHWTKISAVTVDGNTATITLQDDLPDNVSIRFKDPDENIVDIERENRIVKRVVSLRWEPLI